MDGETLAMALFVAAPLVLGLGARAYVRRCRGSGATGTRRALQLGAGNLLVFLFLVSSLALAGECWLRFVYDSTDAFGLLRTTGRWFDRHYKMNNIGCRDDEDYDLSRSASPRRRVDFIGDSYTVGHGVPEVSDRFANLVRAKRPGWQVHAFARNGMDTGAQVSLVEHDLDAVAAGSYRCDVVVLVYCLNDISDVDPDIQRFYAHINGIAQRGVLARSSYLADWLLFMSIIAREPDLPGCAAPLVHAYGGGAWETQRQRLRALHAAVVSHGGRLAVVTFPNLDNLGPGYAFRGVHAQLSEFWRAEHVPELDLLTVFDARDSGELIVGKLDAHPNERAHALAAEAIVPFLDQVVGAK